MREDLRNFRKVVLEIVGSDVPSDVLDAAILQVVALVQLPEEFGEREYESEVHRMDVAKKLRERFGRFVLL